MHTAQGQRRRGPGTPTAFARFVLCGGGVGLASSFAVSATASVMPWTLANALITTASTILATELHARFTFAAGRHADLRQHTQSAGSAVAAYAVTCAAMLVLHRLVAAPGALLEQGVYLAASALAGVARFAVLRLVVFARQHAQAAPADRPADRATAAPRRRPPGGSTAVGAAALCRTA